MRHGGRDRRAQWDGADPGGNDDAPVVRIGAGGAATLIDISAHRNNLASTTVDDLAAGQLNIWRNSLPRTTLLSHQAVAFPLASLIAELDVVRAVLREPAEQPSTEQDAALAARILARASELGRQAARHAIHFSGERGLTGASRCSGLYVRLRDETARWGSPGQLWRLATLIDETGRVRP